MASNSSSSVIPSHRMLRGPKLIWKDQQKQESREEEFNRCPLMKSEGLQSVKNSIFTCSHL